MTVVRTFFTTLSSGIKVLESTLLCHQTLAIRTF